jgi:2-keto-3-deoxy-L-rhamnonate aldolase RhmA
MAIIPNRMKQCLLEGRIPVSFNVSRMHGPEVAAIAASCGFEWLFIDMEHSSMDTKTAAAICISALGWGVTPVIRAASHAHYHATRLLDAGAQGIIVPHVDTEKEAQAVVDNCRFTPLGRRSLSRPSPQLRYGGGSMAEAIKALNDNTLVIVMLETEEAIANADAIAAVEGIDGMLIGTNDLAADLGIPGQFSHERIDKAYTAAISAAKRHGKYLGMGGVYEPALMEKWIRAGVSFVLGGNDIAFILAAAKERRTMLTNVIESL